MSRVQKFREIRHFKRKLILAFSFFILTLFVGIGAVDYSVSTLLCGKEGFGIFSVGPYGNDYYKISVFNNSLYINTKYISRDYKRLVEWINSKKELFIPKK